MATSTEIEPHRRPARRRGPGGPVLRVAVLPLLVAALAACSGSPPDAASGSAAATWSVTAWGEHHEVFAEMDALAAGETAVAHTHVTALDGFSPLTEGRVEVVLRREGGEETFSADGADRPGIFPVEITPGAPGEAELVFRLRSAGGEEEIRGGRVRVGTAGDPGAVVVAPAPRGPTGGGEPIPFLKEEQWRADFATRWVRRSAYRESVEGFARVRPAAGGEARLTAPVDAVVLPQPWPWPGRPVVPGQALFRLVPRTDAHNLPDLEAEVTGLEQELATARARLGRLQELLEMEAVPRRDVEEVRTRVETLEARLGAARRNLEAVRAVRTGSRAAGETVTLAAPFSGEVATVTASPGAAVSAGDELARVVRTDPLWLEVALDPQAARRLRAGAGVTGVVVAAETGPGGPELEVAADRVRLVSVAPEIDRSTGTIPVLVEVTGGHRRAPALGATVRTHLLLAGERQGIVIPSSALVDDGGVNVVYLQLSGERFARQPVEVLQRRGEEVLVEGLVPGQRLVASGGAAVRRSSLLASGQSHGHVH